MESNEHGDSKDYPKWRAVFDAGSGGREVPPESAQDPLGKLAGALAFVCQGAWRASKSQVGRNQLKSSLLRFVRSMVSRVFCQCSRMPNSAISPAGFHKRHGGIAAVFLAKDINTERLLKAEAGLTGAA